MEAGRTHHGWFIGLVMVWTENIAVPSNPRFANPVP